MSSPADPDPEPVRDHELASDREPSGTRPTEPPPTAFALRPPRHRVDPRCRPWWVVQTALWSALPVVVLVVLGVFLAPARGWLLLSALVVLVFGLVLTVVAPRVRWRIHRWEVTEDALYSRTGLFWEEWRAAPLSRIQTVDMDRGPLQRAFGIATISVSTASARGAVRINALDAEQAAELVERFTHLTEGDEQDAT